MTQIQRSLDLVNTIYYFKVSVISQNKGIRKCLGIVYCQTNDNRISSLKTRESESVWDCLLSNERQSNQFSINNRLSNERQSNQFSQNKGIRKCLGLFIVNRIFKTNESESVWDCKNMITNYYFCNKKLNIICIGIPKL